ncbi:glycosyltransferase family 4 protein [Bradyrhizobium sp. NP1]|uniref:glycosyltransferase family 4 protein n=1 Tax=Bradyrhizobium sp. NP1 TaxID=3049772 RepID=UPI0025A64171|nr:glycosyltransferase family 4 protein [Bradyrhizobium sp. NP1]WJR76305.1 glycosyltransferase family 4 protein [Bradyrhizobium sp. NP1]
MRAPAKVVVVSQHYPPDRSTTASIMSEIAEHLAMRWPVLVLSGTPGSATNDGAPARRAVIEEVRNQLAAKAALIRRAVIEASFAVRVFVRLVRRLQRGDVAIAVTAPFLLPYAVVAAAKLKRARSVLILHDLYPEVLVAAGLLRPKSLLAMALRGVNRFTFRALDSIITIGRDAERLLLRYRGLRADKISFIPNWATLAPAVRPSGSDNPYRPPSPVRFVVGLSGNLGFTHDPDIVFEAARMLAGDAGIHFLLSGWGVGFERLKEMQAQAGLVNVTLVDRVEETQLEQFLSAADVWLIPYRRDVAGVSVPSRFYNLLAVGRPVILVSEPDAEAALILTENRLGWVVQPAVAQDLARAIRAASRADDPSLPERAVAVAQRFSLQHAMAGYAAVVERLLGEGKQTEPGR